MKSVTVAYFRRKAPPICLHWESEFTSALTEFNEVLRTSIPTCRRKCATLTEICRFNYGGATLKKLSTKLIKSVSVSCNLKDDEFLVQTKY